MKKTLQSLLTWGFISITTVCTPLFASRTQAAESIFVRYKDTEVTVTRSELNDFTNTGELPTELQKLLGTEEELPDIVRTALSEQITVPTFLQDFIEGSNGEFLLFKLDQAIASASGRTEDGLESLKTAVLNSIEDDQVSFMEIIDKYPQNTIRVNLTSLEGTYNQVKGFVEKTLPALEVAKDVLSDFICDCETAPMAASQSYQSQKVSDQCAEKNSKTTVSENSHTPKSSNLPNDPSSLKLPTVISEESGSATQLPVRLAPTQ